MWKLGGNEVLVYAKAKAYQIEIVLWELIVHTSRATKLGLCGDDTWDPGQTGSIHIKSEFNQRLHSSSLANSTAGFRSRSK